MNQIAQVLQRRVNALETELLLTQEKAVRLARVVERLESVACAFAWDAATREDVLRCWHEAIEEAGRGH